MVVRASGYDQKFAVGLAHRDSAPMMSGRDGLSITYT